MDEDYNGNAIIYTRTNEDFQEILKAMSFFGDEYKTIKCWNYVEKDIAIFGGPVEVTEWHTKFPFKVYDSVVYKVLKEKEKLELPIWINNDPKLKETLEEFINNCYAINASGVGTMFFFTDEMMLKFIKKHCNKNLDNYKTTKELPYNVIQFTIESLLRRFGYYKYYSNHYSTSWSDNLIWVVDTNFPFEYMYNEVK